MAKFHPVLGERVSEGLGNLSKITQLVNGPEEEVINSAWKSSGTHPRGGGILAQPNVFRLRSGI